MKKTILVFSILIALFAAACNQETKTPDSPTTSKTNTSTDKKDETKKPETKLTEDGYVTSETGTEKEKPTAGKANVQGKALFNGKGAAGVEAKLCETFNKFSGCGGKQYTTKTDANGEYLFKNVEPKDYEGLTVRVFNTGNYIFAARNFGIASAKYKIEADKTFFAPETNLFKDDLKILSPKSGAKVEVSALEIKWDAYPDAAYYKLSLYGKGAVSSPYINTKVEATSFKPEKPMINAEYSIRLEAYNANDVKLSTNDDDFVITLSGGVEPTPAANANK